MNKRWHPDFRSTFQGCEYSIWATNHWKINRKSGCHLLFRIPKSSFGEHKLYPSQTKIWERWTKDEMRILPLPNEDSDGDCPVGHARTSQAPMCSVDSKHLFNDSYPKSSTHKPWKKASKIRSLSFFIPPKSSFGRDNLSECFFQALFKGVSTRFGLRIVEKCLENAFAKVGQAFQHLRLGWVHSTPPKHLLFTLPKSSFGMDTCMRCARLVCTHCMHDVCTMLTRCMHDVCTIFTICLMCVRCSQDAWLTKDSIIVATCDAMTHLDAIIILWVRQTHPACCDFDKHINMSSYEFETLWRAKKSHFQASVESGMKK